MSGLLSVNRFFAFSPMPYPYHIIILFHFQMSLFAIVFTDAPTPTAGLQTSNTNGANKRMTRRIQLIYLVSWCLCVKSLAGVKLDDYIRFGHGFLLLYLPAAGAKSSGTRLRQATQPCRIQGFGLYLRHDAWLVEAPGRTIRAVDNPVRGGLCPIAAVHI